MATEKLESFKRNAEKRRLSAYYPLSFRIIFFLFLINCLSVALSTSKVELVINEGGEQWLLNDGFTFNPTKVLVNDAEYADCHSSKKCCYNLPTGPKRITLEFGSGITSSEGMFKARNNIKEIDLSNFDFSSVVNMGNMFFGCSGLENITFRNANTHNVVNGTNISGLYFIKIN